MFQETYFFSFAFYAKCHAARRRQQNVGKKHIHEPRGANSNSIVPFRKTPFFRQALWQAARERGQEVPDSQVPQGRADAGAEGARRPEDGAGGDAVKKKKGGHIIQIPPRFSFSKKKSVHNLVSTFVNKGEGVESFLFKKVIF